ncbi:hypothetical protein GCM10020254_60370 [Streptomyces goshikiensis]
MRSPKLAALELKRFGRGKLPRAALVALLLLPLLYGALYLWSFWDPYGRLDKVPVALVNSDQGATVDGKHLDAGGEITKKLRDSRTFDWREVSAAEAAKGLEDGKFYLSLTMPADFSEKIASSSGDDPTTGALQVRTNDANNYVVGSISRTVFSEVRSAASKNASRGFLDKIFVNFSDLHDKTAEAADGADQIKDGAGKAQQGAKDLAEGLDTAEEKSDELTSGLKKLGSGAAQLKTGTRGIADGTQKLADKMDGVAGKARPFVQDPKQLADTAVLVADTAKVTRNHLDKLAEKAPAVARISQLLATRTAADYNEACGPGTKLSPALCERLKKTKEVAAEGGPAQRRRQQPGQGLGRGHRQAPQPADGAGEGRPRARREGPPRSSPTSTPPSARSTPSTTPPTRSPPAWPRSTPVWAPPPAAPASSARASASSATARTPSRAACSSSWTAAAPSPTACTTVPARSRTTTRSSATPAPRSWPTRSSSPTSPCTRRPTTAPASPRTSSRSPSGSVRWSRTC